MENRRTKNLRASRPSPFNKGLPNNTTFSQIHLDGQFLEGFFCATSFRIVQ